MLPVRVVAVAVLTMLLLAGCGSTDPGSPRDPGSPDDPGPPQDPDAESCTYTLTEDVTMPTRLVATGAECDYLLSGIFYVSSELRIDPGTTIVAAPRSRIYVQDGGRLLSSGTSDERIEFVGQVAAQGSWYGICFSGDHLESRLDFVDIYWAGAVFQPSSDMCRAALGASYHGGEPVHVTNSLIVGAYTS